MGDMRECFQLMKEMAKSKKTKNLAEADGSIWRKHTAYHWFNYLDNGDKVEYWPSTNKMSIRGKVFSAKSKKGQSIFNELKSKS
jgi:hypothetical protein